MSTAISLRNPAIDMVRFIAMIMVVSLHTTHTHYNNLDLSWLLYNLSLPAVPLFFLCSGYLLLGRPRSRCNLRYVAGKIASCVKVVAVMAIAAVLALQLFSPVEIIRTIWRSVVQTGPVDHLWFLWALCIVYLPLPLINRLYNSRMRIFNALTLLLIVIQAVIFVLNITSQFELYLPQTFRIWNWLSYFMLGGILHRYDFRLSKPFPTVCVTAAAMLASMYLIYPVMDINFCEYFYCSPVVVIFVCCLFVACINTRASGRYNFPALASLFLPVYLIHPYVIYALDHTFGRLYWQIPLLTFISTLSLSVIIALAITKVKPLKALLSV
ncbi:MAG: acyltransferase family protein [Bacteroidales bacterium]|nr:acyltransferase family protein [Bacteroidales bacterium]